MSDFLFDFNTDCITEVPRTAHVLVVESAVVKKSSTGKQMITLKMKIEEEKETNSTDNKGMTIYDNIVLEQSSERAKKFTATKCKYLADYAGVSVADEDGKVTLDSIREMVRALEGVFVECKLKKDTESGYMKVGWLLEPSGDTIKEEEVVI